MLHKRFTAPLLTIFLTCAGAKADIGEPTIGTPRPKSENSLGLAFNPYCGSYGVNIGLGSLLDPRDFDVILKIKMGYFEVPVQIPEQGRIQITSHDVKYVHCAV